MQDVRAHRYGPNLLPRLVDAGVILGALWATVTIYSGTWGTLYLTAALVAALLFLLIGQSTEAYAGNHGGGSVGPVLNAWLITLAALATLAWMTKTTADFSRVAVGLWCLVAPLGMVGWRLAGRRLARLQGQRRTAIVGTDARAARLAEVVANAPSMGLEVVGFYVAAHEPIGGETHSNGIGALPAPMRGGFDALLRDVAAGSLDVVYVTLPMAEEATIEVLLDRLADTTVSVYLLPDTLIRGLLHSRWVQVGPEPAVSVFESPHLGLGGVVKRIEDLVLGTVILILAALPMLAVALAVKTMTRGPVTFRQRRFGIDGREFMVIKFRTMTVAEDGDQVEQARPGDSRVTRVGAFLRRTSLDELPQLFNVLRGEMSLVGPRPHAVAHNEEYRRLIPGYMRRHKIKPGITGWAQVNGWRGPTDTLDKMAGRLQFDLWYLRRWSLWLDLEILARTPWVVWIGSRGEAF